MLLALGLRVLRRLPQESAGLILQLDFLVGDAAAVIAAEVGPVRRRPLLADQVVVDAQGLPGLVDPAGGTVRVSCLVGVPLSEASVAPWVLIVVVHAVVEAVGILLGEAPLVCRRLLQRREDGLAAELLTLQIGPEISLVEAAFGRVMLLRPRLRHIGADRHILQLLRVVHEVRWMHLHISSHLLLPRLQRLACPLQAGPVPRLLQGGTLGRLRTRL